MKNLTKQSIVGMKELRLNMAKYVSAVNKGGSFIIVSRSKPIFRMSPVDEYGDEGVWETVVDFTKIKKGGVPIDEVISRL